jgi:hypothetical protein
MSNREITTATINKSAIVHYVYDAFDGQVTLCNGEKMGFRRIARPTTAAADCKRCTKSPMAPK